jgi:hypothetical protein
MFVSNTRMLKGFHVTTESIWVDSNHGCNRVLPEELRGLQVVEKCGAFMEPEG